MTETDNIDFYKVEHGEDYVLDREQFDKLIAQKFKRNGILAQLIKERESRHIAD